MDARAESFLTGTNALTRSIEVTPHVNGVRVTLREDFFSVISCHGRDIQDAFNKCVAGWEQARKTVNIERVREVERRITEAQQQLNELLAKKKRLES